MNQIVPFEQGGRPPAAFAGRKSTLNSAVQAGVQASFAVLSYKGRNWRLKYRGEDTLITDDRGPVPFLDVIIVGAASGISKQFYDKKYTEGDDSAPDCFSVNGVAPDKSSPKLQCSTCAVCPKNQWGSRISEDGKKGKACQDSRRLAVVPAEDPVNEAFGGPIMLRVPPTSLKHLANFGMAMERKGAPIEAVVTRLSFDYDVAYPLLQFTASRWLTDAEAAVVVGEVMENPLIDRMLNEAVTEATHDPASAPADPETAGLSGAPPAAVAEQAAAKAQAEAAARVQAEAQAKADVAAKAQAEAAAKAAATPAPKRSPFGAAKTTAVAAPPPAAADPAPAKPTTVVQTAPSDMEAAIDDLLNAPV